MNKKLSNHLKAYSALAGAILTSNSASADIVYTDVNDVTFSNNGQFYDLDLNNDGTPDFQFTISKSQFGGTFTTYYGGTSSYNILLNNIKVQALNNNEVMISQGYYSNFVKALPLNTPINQLEVYANGTNAMGSFYSFIFSNSSFVGSVGSWGAKTNHYAGLKLNVSGKTYYGWVRLDVAAQYNSFTVKDYAYQDCVGLTINAGDPGNVAADIAINVNASDVADIGSASDLQISFTKAANESTISEYRVMIVKAAQAGTFSINTAKNISFPNYIAHTPNGSNFLFNPASNQKDVGGDPIQQNVPYKIFVLSMPNGNTSTSLAMAQQAGTTTLTMGGTSVKDTERKGWNVFASDKKMVIECNLADMQNTEWFLYNNTGQQVISSKMEMGIQTIDLQNYPTGIYYFKTNGNTPAIKLLIH